MHKKQKQAIQNRDLFPVATKTNRMNAGTELSLSCVYVRGLLLYFSLTVWGTSNGFSSAVSCLCGSAWYVVLKQGLREGERCGRGAGYARMD